MGHTTIRVFAPPCPDLRAPNREVRDAGELLRRADIALYQAKAAGKSRVVCFVDGMSLVAA